MLSQLALAEKGASDSEIVEFIPLTACGYQENRYLDLHLYSLHQKIK